MDAIGVIRLALRVLTDRLIVLLALCMDCGMTIYTIYFGDWQRITALALFLLFTLLLTRIKGAKDEASSASEG